MPAERRYGMDHDHYDWSPIVARPRLSWPEGKPLALCVLIVLDHYEWRPPEGTWQLKRPSGGLFPLPYPDYVRLSHREYGARVGVFRLLDVLEQHGVPATVTLDALTAERTPWLVRHLLDRGVELIGHGQAGSRMITERMSAEDERTYLAESIAAFTQAVGRPPRGWYGPEGNESSRTPELLAEAGLDYVCDWVNDEQPYPMRSGLVSLPLLLETDDEFALAQRRVSAPRWARVVADTAEVLRRDGADNGRLLVLGLRPWLSGQPFRSVHLDRALGEVMGAGGVWAARGGEIVDWFRGRGPGR
ncbi:MAG: polysaccharide deacetylase family protein [Acidimicrobiales bacterium]